MASERMRLQQSLKVLLFLFTLEGRKEIALATRCQSQLASLTIESLALARAGKIYADRYYLSRASKPAS